MENQICIKKEAIDISTEFRPKEEIEENSSTLDKTISLKKEEDTFDKICSKKEENSSRIKKTENILPHFKKETANSKILPMQRQIALPLYNKLFVQKKEDETIFDKTIYSKKEENSSRIKETENILPHFKKETDNTKILPMQRQVALPLYNTSFVQKEENETTFDETICSKKEENSSRIKETENILPHFKKETDNTKILPMQRPIALPLYNKSFSQTWFRTSVIEYNWEIDRAITLFKITKEIFSTTFPETALFRIKLIVDIDTSDILNSTLKFYLLTKREFTGVCDVCMICPTTSHKILCTSVTGLISNMKLLYETTLQSLEKYLFMRSKLLMFFELEIFHQSFNRSIHMNIIPSNTTLHNLNSEHLILDNFKDKGEELITFKIKEERYNISKNILCATKSKFFKNVCDVIEKNKKVIPYEIEIKDMTNAFREMLSFILSGSLPDPHNYNMLRDLLTITHKFDVQTLKALCEHYLLRMINIQNSIDLIQLAFSCNAKSLEKYAALFIKMHLKEIVRIKKFQVLPQKDLDKIIELIHSINIPLESNIF